MADMVLEGLRSRKLGIWGQNDIGLVLLGPKWRCFGAL